MSKSTQTKKQKQSKNASRGGGGGGMWYHIIGWLMNFVLNGMRCLYTEDLS